MWHWRSPRDPPPFMGNTILNFHFDYWNPSLRTQFGYCLPKQVVMAEIASFDLGPMAQIEIAPVRRPKDFLFCVFFIIHFYVLLEPQSKGITHSFFWLQSPKPYGHIFLVLFTCSNICMHCVCSI